MNFLFDANGDGLLDIFLAADRPFSNDVIPGLMLINQGNRRWKQDPNLREYSKAMLLTDVDLDGFANELVVTRDACFPERRGPETDPRYVRKLSVMIYDLSIHSSAMCHSFHSTGILNSGHLALNSKSSAKPAQSERLPYINLRLAECKTLERSTPMCHQVIQSSLHVARMDQWVHSGLTIRIVL